ncbi:uncharacterized protein EHS24_003565 [Apiotrichum porosum]|uniref:Glutamyl-tRNA(Gln) amidotransferase subunit B, mitochondrial n=1 Tax=Apiotrichum porosum TaxID=105984 RepID=A0A427XET2_9TREE|nr:uncharacterized protein EHS24_003565 [Apiotrichum porosum]RSH77257.1 hypothetical protein EHS24_003565 [Apiotrichum porosum]
MASFLRTRIHVARSAGTSISAGPSRLRSPLFSRAASSSATTASSSEEGWELIIGLEIHAQIRTGSKLFSRAKTVYDEMPNTHVQLLDAAFPGTLPVIDPEAVRLALLTAMALNCNINPRSTFDRKHYFYHDIPPSYQITQHYNPIARNGTLRFEAGEPGVNRTFDVGIHQLQIEQDTAKSQTVASEVLVDLNRAGTGLMEIVTEPHMRSSDEAGAFVRKLQGLLRRVGSGDGDMEKGNLRVDANVSVRRPGQPFRTRCEVKNINSVRFLQQAIEAERKRHIEHYETQPGVPLRQETRGLNEMTGETYSLRSKEDAEDYRYMPDSNLPALAIAPAFLESLRTAVPELPWETVSRLTSTFGVDRRDVETLIGLDEYTGAGIAYFEAVVGNNAELGKKASNWVTHELLGRLTKNNKTWSPEVVPASLLGEIVSAVEGGKVTGTVGRSVLKHVVMTGDTSKDFETLVSELGLSASADDLRASCEAVIAKLPKEAEKIRQGNQKVVMRLVGEVMKMSKGAADAKRAKDMFFELLK